MALSYVWGMATQFMLTTDALTEALKPGFFESLGTRIPQSIQDAIQVCRNIGVRHIWIDALCIVQDGNKDKKDQIALMDEIYGHALAVLVVAAEDDVVVGLREGAKSVALMLLENVDGVYYRVNWAWKLSQHLTIQEWMDQKPIQKLIIWG